MGQGVGWVGAIEGLEDTVGNFSERNNKKMEYSGEK